MKVKLNIHNILRNEMTGTRRIPNTLHLDDLLESPGSMVEIDLDQLFVENRMIAHVWTIDDVHEVRPDLTEHQAWRVLEECDRDLDSEQGICWETIDAAAEKLFGDTSDRFKRFAQVVCEYARDDAKTNLNDLLTDAMHWCRKQHVSFDDSLEMARAHFAAETKKGDKK